ncbi:MAG: choice-of-anchor D domain-containing protein [Ignavibacteria bacterium]|nr:choice-of-anchor D domain-containing protein [Ignavibacteria bacterium]
MIHSIKKYLILLLSFISIVTVARSQTQSDISDAVWSIVLPLPASQNVDMRQCLVGSSKDSVVINFVRNIGSWKFRVDSIYFRGADANAFRLVSGAPPYSVAANKNYYGEIRFAPKRVGIHNAEIVIITQTDTLIQQITGEGIQPQLAIAEKFIDFGKVGVGDSKDSLQCATIRNIGTVPITIIRTSYGLPNDKDFSTITGNTSFVLNPGPPQLMDLRFSPSDSGRTSGTLEFHYNGLGSPAIIQLFGEGRKKPQITHITPVFKDLLCEQEFTDSIKIKNDGAMNLIISDIQINGANKDDFIVNQNYLCYRAMESVCPSYTV